MTSGIILAGGMSKRMKQNKMLLPFKGRPLIEHTINTMASICDEIVIVTGFYEIDYLQHTNYNISIKQVHNARHLRGMFTSVQEGVKHISSDCFIIPGDYPLVSPKTYTILADAEGLIRVPVYKNRRGHPIYISKELFPALLKEPLDSNLKHFRDQYQVTYVEVDDPNIRFDIDDPIEYQKLLDLERMNSYEDSTI